MFVPLYFIYTTLIFRRYRFRLKVYNRYLRSLKYPQPQCSRLLGQTKGIENLPFMYSNYHRHGIISRINSRLICNHNLGLQVIRVHLLRCLENNKKCHLEKLHTFNQKEIHFDYLLNIRTALLKTVCVLKTMQSRVKILGSI